MMRKMTSKVRAVEIIAKREVAVAETLKEKTVAKPTVERFAMPARRVAAT